MEKHNYQVEEFYAFKIKPMWGYFKKQHFSFWMICGYLFFEFVKPQALFPAISFIPWAQLLLVGAMIGALTDPTVKWVKSTANVYIVLFAIMILISIATALYPEYSNQSFMLFFGWFIIYFLIINIVNTRERFYIFLLIYLIAAGKIAVGTSKSWAARGFSFEGWGLMGPTGYFQNSGELAILMVMLFPLAFYLYQNLKSKISLIERGILIVFWVCSVLTILGASSRGSQVALVLQLAIIFRKSIFRPKAFLGVLFFCVLIFQLLPEEQKNRFSSAGDDRPSQQRLLYWEHGWEMMKEYPLTGVGYFNFIPHYERYYSYDLLYPTAQLPHNIFIQVGTDAGFIALFFFVLIIMFCLLAAMRLSALKTLSEMNRGIIAGLGLGVFGFLIAGQFVTVTYYPFLWVHMAFIVAFGQIIKKENKVNNEV